MHPHCAGHYQQTAVGGVHPVRDLEGDVTQDAQRTHAKDHPFQLAASGLTMLRSQEEVDRHSEEGHRL